MLRKTLLLTVSIIILFTSVRAKGIHLVPGEPLRTTSTGYEVHGRQGWLIGQKLRFGPYTTSYIRRSAIRSWGATSGVPGVFTATHMQGRQSIRFSLTDGRDTITAETVTRVKSTDLIVGDRPNSLPNILLDVLATGTARQQSNFSAAFRLGTQDAEWALFLDNTAAQLRRDEPAGFLRCDSMYYTIVPVWQVSRKGKVTPMLFGAIGLEFRDAAGQTRAAVSLMNGGDVLLGDATDTEKLLLSAACSALLLQSNIE